MSTPKKKFRIRGRTLLRDIIKNKAETVPDKVYMTYVRDFDKEIDEQYTYKDMIKICIYYQID